MVVSIFFFIVFCHIPPKSVSICKQRSAASAPASQGLLNLARLASLDFAKLSLVTRARDRSGNSQRCWFAQASRTAKHQQFALLCVDVVSQSHAFDGGLRRSRTAEGRFAFSIACSKNTPQCLFGSCKKLITNTECHQFGLWRGVGHQHRLCLQSSLEVLNCFCFVFAVTWTPVTRGVYTA